MSQETFNPGDVVYHKANNLRMVVLQVLKDNLKCNFVTSYGTFSQAYSRNEYKFYHFEVSKEPMKEIPVITQLESLDCPHKNYRS